MMNCQPLGAVTPKPYKSVLTGLTYFQFCPSLIHCQPLVAITPKHYKPVMTGLTFLETCPSLIHCQPLKIAQVRQYQPLAENMLKRTRSRQMFSACSPSVAGAVMYPVSRIGSGKVQDKTQDCRVRGGLQCGYERLTQALYVGEELSHRRSPTITTIPRRGEGQANHHNSSEGVRPWGFRGGETGAQSSGKAGIKAVTTRMRRSIGIHIQKGRETGETGRYSPLRSVTTIRRGGRRVEGAEPNTRSGEGVEEGDVRQLPRRRRQTWHGSRPRGPARLQSQSQCTAMGSSIDTRSISPVVVQQGVRCVDGTECTVFPLRSIRRVGCNAGAKLRVPWSLDGGGCGKVQDKTQDCRVRGGLQCGYERLTQALYVGEELSHRRSPTITTIPRRGEGQANHHNSSEGVRPWGFRGGETGAQSSGKAGIKAVTTRMRRSIGIHIQKGRETGETGRYSPLRLL